ncbi:MAG: hypothetical protein V4533_12025 [Pseudomonadota bacterium]|jgi:hypothetical protein
MCAQPETAHDFDPVAHERNEARIAVASMPSSRAAGAILRARDGEEYAQIAPVEPRTLAPLFQDGKPA